jgi:hypothetical protein
MQHRHPHILSASTNLLAICFIIIGGLKFSDLDAKSYADEVAWAATTLLFLSTVSSYFAIRGEDARPWLSNIAEWSFLGGVFALIGSVLIAATSL